LLEFIRRNAAADSSIELYQETELETMIHDFFDSAVGRGRERRCGE
jgi:hypothetical protein